MPCSLLDRLTDNAPPFLFRGHFQLVGQDKLPEKLGGP